MTQIHTQHGWRDEALDAREGLGRNAKTFAALSDHMIKRQRRQTRVRWIEAIIFTLAFIGGFTVAHTVYGVIHEWNAERLEAAE